MCKCRSAEEHSQRTKYVAPSVGDDVVRFGDDSRRVGLLYDLDSYTGGLPRAHVVYDDGSTEAATQFLFQAQVNPSVSSIW